MLSATTATPEPHGADAFEVRPAAQAAPRTAGLVIAAVWLAAVVYVVLLSLLAARGGVRVAAAGSTLEQVMFLLVWAAATPGILWSARRLPIERRRWPRRVATHLAVAIPFIFLLNIVAPTLAWVVMGRPTAYRLVWERAFAGFVAVGHLALVVYAFLLGVGHYLRTVDLRRREQLRAAQLRADLASAQLRALTLQLQPHFLFNTLNAVGALILTERNREAFEVVGRLGDLLRALLAVERRAEVSLREELELARAYVGIEQARLGDRLRVEWEIAADTANAYVPPMLLQPLVENAVRHGVARMPAGGCLTIRAARVNTSVILEVSDNGPGPAVAADASAPTGLGIDTTRRRLTHLYGDACRLELVRVGGWTSTRVELPYHASAPDTDQPADAGAAA